MDLFEGFEVIHTYSTDDAIEDGWLVEKFKNRWNQLSGGRPIVVTRSIHDEFTDAAIIEVWNQYAYWVKNTMPTLPEEDQMFTTRMNKETIWVIDDGFVITIMRPSEY